MKKRIFIIFLFILLLPLSLYSNDAIFEKEDLSKLLQVCKYEDLLDFFLDKNLQIEDIDFEAYSDKNSEVYYSQDIILVNKGKDKQWKVYVEFEPSSVEEITFLDLTFSLRDFGFTYYELLYYLTEIGLEKKNTEILSIRERIDFLYYKHILNYYKFFYCHDRNDQSFSFVIVGPQSGSPYMNLGWKKVFEND